MLFIVNMNSKFAAIVRRWISWDEILIVIIEKLDICFYWNNGDRMIFFFT